MIKNSKDELSRLTSFSYDLTTIEALKKLFLECFIRGDASSQDIKLLDKAFRELEQLKDMEEVQKERSQIGL